MVKLSDYKFGKITANNKEYTNDIIILPDGEIYSWWRKEGHKVCNKDMEKIYQSNPEIIVIGTGAFGFMKVLSEVKDYCKSHNIKLIYDKTARAIEEFNKIEGRKAGGFHLTC